MQPSAIRVSGARAPKDGLGPGASADPGFAGAPSAYAGFGAPPACLVADGSLPRPPPNFFLEPLEPERMDRVGVSRRCGRAFPSLCCIPTQAPLRRGFSLAVIENQELTSNQIFMT